MGVAGFFAGGMAQGLQQGFQMGGQFRAKQLDNQSADIVGGTLKGWAKEQLDKGAQPQNVPVPGATPMTGLQQTPITGAVPGVGAPTPAPGVPLPPQRPPEFGASPQSPPQMPPSTGVQQAPVQAPAPQQPMPQPNPLQQPRPAQQGPGPQAPAQPQNVSGQATPQQLQAMTPDVRQQYDTINRLMQDPNLSTERWAALKQQRDGILQKVGAGGAGSPQPQQPGTPPPAASGGAKADMPDWLRSTTGPLQPDTLFKLGQGESRWGANKGTGAGGVAGPMQFKPGTAAQTLRNHPELRDADPSTPQGAARYAQAYATDNAKVLQGAGLPVSQGALILAHQQGAGGAKALMSEPNANVVDALSKAYNGDRRVAAQAVTGNGGTTDMTAGQFAQHVINYYDKQGGSPGGIAPLGKDEGFEGRQLPMGGQGGPMNMQQLVGLIMSKNPDISNAALARAVERMAPLLNNDAKAAYNQQLLDYKYTALEQKNQELEKRLASAEGIAAGKKDTAEKGIEAKKDIAASNNATKKDVAVIARDGKMDVAKLNAGSRQTVAEINQAGRRDIAELNAASRERIAHEGNQTKFGISAANRLQKDEQFAATLAEKTRQFDERQAFLEQKLQEEQEQKKSATAEKAREADERISYLRQALDTNRELRSEALRIQERNADTNAKRQETQAAQGEERLRQGDVRLEQGQQRVEQGAARVAQGERRLDQGDQRVAQGAERLGIAKEKLAQFAQREERLASQFHQRQQLAEEKLAAAKDDKSKALAFKEYEGALKDYGAKVRAFIDADLKMTGPDKVKMKQLLAKEMSAAQADIDEKKLALRNAQGGSPAAAEPAPAPTPQPGQPSQPAAPQASPEPDPQVPAHPRPPFQNPVANDVAGASRRAAENVNNEGIGDMFRRMFGMGGGQPTGAPPAAGGGGKPIPDDIKQQAVQAVQSGARKDAVIKRLKELGYDTTGF